MVKIDVTCLKTLINGNRMVYEYLTEKKGYYLDPFKSNFITNTYLRQLVKEEIWAPIKDESENWNKEVSITKM